MARSGSVELQPVANAKQANPQSGPVSTSSSTLFSQAARPQPQKAAPNPQPRLVIPTMFSPLLEKPQEPSCCESCFSAICTCVARACLRLADFCLGSK